jgi:clan AA aspartic protease (TIGR02281 family)
LHRQISRARDEFLAHVLNLRKIVDTIDDQYQNPDRVISGLIRTYNEKEQTTVKLEPTSAFAANIKKLDRLEEKILTDRIKLRKEFNTYWVAAVVNDEPAIEMVVDSGASTVLLPYETAVKLGVKPGKNDPEIRMVVADGRTITGYRMKIDTLRVGQFIAKDVECAVLGADAVNAEPLLGMSFLADFKFEIDSGNSELLLTDLNAENNRSRTTGTGSSGRNSDSRVVFPSANLKHLRELAVPHIKLNGQFSVEDDHLVSVEKQATALQLSDVVSDFELKLEGDFAGKGAIYFLIGWNSDSSTGQLLWYSEDGDSAKWWIQEVEDGQLISVQTQLTNKVARAGVLQVAVDDGQLTVESNGEALIDAHPISLYHPGAIVFGTRPGTQGGKVIEVSRIEIEETPSELEEYEGLPQPSFDDFSDAKAVNLIAAKKVAVPKDFPTIGISRDKPVKPATAMEVTDETLISPNKAHAIVRLSEHEDQFHMAFPGADFWPRGYVYWLVGWDEKTSSGFQIEHQQLIRSSSLVIREIRDGKVISYTHTASSRIPKKAAPSLMLKDNVFAFRLSGRSLIKGFVLEDYKPGAILMGTRPNQYGGKAMKIKNVEVRRLD